MYNRGRITLCAGLYRQSVTLCASFYRDIMTSYISFHNDIMTISDNQNNKKTTEVNETVVFLFATLRVFSRFGS